MIELRDIIGFTYDADIHCIPCTVARFGPIHDDLIDSEGNPVRPVFTWDELSDDVCGDCLTEIRG